MEKHYETTVFEGKKVKRSVSLENIKRISRWGKNILSLGRKKKRSMDKGCAVSLCGPAIETHVKEILPLLRCKSELLVAEWSKKTIEKENMVERVKSIGDERVVFYVGNVWDGIRQHYLKKKGWNHKHVLFDLDFCNTVDELLTQKLQIELKHLARSKLPRRQGFWVFLTFLQRGDMDKEYWDFANKVGRIFHEAGWQISYHHMLPYRDGHKGAPMCNIVFRFHWDYSKQRRNKNDR